VVAAHLRQRDQDESRPQPFLMLNGETGAHHEHSNLITALDLLTRQPSQQDGVIGQAE
jgi:hypothetical protein